MATNTQPGVDYVAVNMDPVKEFEDDPNSSSSYYDVLMIGKTGKGKSTVGNKYLGINPETKKLYEEDEKIENVIQIWGQGHKNFYFEMGDDDSVESVTKSCVLLSNKNTMDRVLDTRGFADSEATREYGVTRSNLQNDSAVPASVRALFPSDPLLSSRKRLPTKSRRFHPGRDRSNVWLLWEEDIRYHGNCRNK